jgi:hypothetical protein
MIFEKILSPTRGNLQRDKRPFNDGSRAPKNELLQRVSIVGYMVTVVTVQEGAATLLDGLLDQLARSTMESTSLPLSTSFGSVLARSRKCCSVFALICTSS